ncbi:hypothetical protein MN116_008231 [Schistosoma mekongi]|uniref:Tetratricopeptide repeat protein 39B n=1 Tax=Schistosoma mekongi TaxID=38744 RepID=A0AAE2D1U0_SCHME|nr:hypothetical protein MN116_008231 [Schistosoma mekongi]
MINYLGPWYENPPNTNNTNNTNKNNTPTNNDTYEKLLDGIAEAKTTIDLFLNNRFEEAKNRLNMNTHVGMYQELANSTILFIQGMATIEQENLELAKEQLKTTLKACQTNRRKIAISEAFTKQIDKNHNTIYTLYTDEQAHAELCYAEGLLQLAFLSMLQDEKLTSLIKCSLKIRQCYKCYRICWRILKYRNWQNEISKSAFESGVHLGVGAFNLMISMLPRRVLKLLEFVGFSGDRHFGLEQLRLGAEMQDSLRGPLCSLLLLAYDLYATHMLGDSVVSVSSEQPEHMKEARELLQRWSIVYPNSAIFLLLAGRLEEISGNLNEAIQLFQRSIDSQSDWIHYHHLCYWELIWCYALQADWQKAILYTEKLALESRWSQASYRYMKAAFLLQSIEDRTAYEIKNANNVYEKPQEIVDQLLADIPNLVKRFGGRSLPIEKIALRKSTRYFAQNKTLTLPALELIFIWNGFKMIQSQPDAITAFIMICENKINELFQKRDTSETFNDDYCLALMLKGVCLRCRGQTFQAFMCFTEIIQSKRKLKMDTYLLPYCEMELCHLSYEDGDIDEAVKHLEKALSYKNYHLESRLHFRIHEMDTRLRGIKRKLSTSSIQQLQTIKKTGSEYHLPLPNLISTNNNNSDNKSISSFKSVDLPINYTSSLGLPFLAAASSSSSSTTMMTTSGKDESFLKNQLYSKKNNPNILISSTDGKRIFDEDDLDDDVDSFSLDYIHDD